MRYNLEDEAQATSLMKNIWPKAAIPEPIVTIWNEPVAVQSILSHAPTNVNPAPIMMQVLSPYFPKIKITIKFPGTNATRKINV